MICQEKWIQKISSKEVPGEIAEKLLSQINTLFQTMLISHTFSVPFLFRILTRREVPELFLNVK